MDLRRGLELARAQEALRRAGANGRRALATGNGALRQAEGTLAKIRENQSKSEDMHAALDELDRKASGADLDQRLAAAGFGTGLADQARRCARPIEAEASQGRRR